MKVAAAQISCLPGEVGANVRKIREFAIRAKKAGADLIVFPEMSDTGYSMPMIKKGASEWNEGAVPRLEQLAEEVSIGIICGVSERDGNNIYNALIFVEAGGEIVGSYRKTHLVTAAPLDERPVFTPGEKFVSVPARGWNFGLTICYDLRFPEVARKLVVEHKADVLVNSSAWPFPRVEHLRILAVARAMENQCYMIVANRAGTDDGVTFCGSSAIIDPYGVVVAAASADREELIIADISQDVLRSVRGRMKVFEHRRGDLY
jgi:predicted amidohydrolase